MCCGDQLNPQPIADVTMRLLCAEAPLRRFPFVHSACNAAQGEGAVAAITANLTLLRTRDLLRRIRASTTRSLAGAMAFRAAHRGASEFRTTTSVRLHQRRAGVFFWPRANRG